MRRISSNGAQLGGGWRGGGLSPFRRPRQQTAIGVARVDLKHADGRQAAGMRQPLALARQHAFILQFAQNVLQPDAILALQRKRLGDLALARTVGIFGDVFEDVFLARAEVAPGCRGLGDSTLAGSLAGAF
jgi:hypothetical protein